MCWVRLHREERDHLSDVREHRQNGQSPSVSLSGHLIFSAYQKNQNCIFFFINVLNFFSAETEEKKSIKAGGGPGGGVYVLCKSQRIYGLEGGGAV